MILIQNFLKKGKKIVPICAPLLYLSRDRYDVIKISDKRLKSIQVIFEKCQKLLKLSEWSIGYL